MRQIRGMMIDDSKRLFFFLRLLSNLSVQCNIERKKTGGSGITFRDINQFGS